MSQEPRQQPAIDGLTPVRIDTAQGAVAACRGGKGPAVLLLHGFPQTGLMWRDVAPLLAQDFEVIVADLPGYGASDCPHALPDSAAHAAMSKRRMATTLVEAMEALGLTRFALVGHDRGGRVAYRTALDHPDRVTAVAVLDVVPTFDVFDRADARLALSFWPFSLLAQPAPLPERLITGAPDAVVDDALAQWGSTFDSFPEDVRRAYVDALRDPARVHAICEDYRAAASIDRDHDREDLESGRRITCPLLALWADEGALTTWYKNEAGPLGLWRRWATDVRGAAVGGGHFFPEANPADTAARIRCFVRGTAG